MKKLISLLMSLALAFSLSTTIFAASPSMNSTTGMISAEAFFQAIQEEYAKYHITFTAENYDPNATYPVTELNDVIENIRSQMATVDNYDEELGAFVTTFDDISASSAPAPYSIMPTEQTFKLNGFANGSVIGSAMIEVTVQATVDAQYNTFMSCNSITSRQYGSAINFESWTQTSTSYTISNDPGVSTLTAYANGTLVTSYTDPVSGIKATYTSDHSIGGPIKLNNAL